MDTLNFKILVITRVFMGCVNIRLEAQKPKIKSNKALRSEAQRPKIKLNKVRRLAANRPKIKSNKALRLEAQKAQN